VEPEFSDEGDIFSLRYLGKRFSSFYNAVQKIRYILKKWFFQFRALRAKNFSPRTPPEKCKITRY
jgi:hypothetical protein